MLAIWSLVPLPFLNQLEHLEVPGSHIAEAWLGEFWALLTSMWDECNCAVVWVFFGIAFLWNWNENWPFPVLWPMLSFPNLLAYWVQRFHSIIFQDLKQLSWNSISSTSFFVVMLSKAHLTSHSRMSGSRSVITPSWLSRGLSFCMSLLETTHLDRILSTNGDALVVCIRYDCLFTFPALALNFS